MSTTSTTVAGIQITQRAGDANKSLIMLHGIGSNRHSFDPLYPYLPADIQLVAWNAPGYGVSAPLDVATPSVDHYAHKLHELTQTLGLTQFVLMGHSLGTLIATAYAHHYSACVDRIILLACAQGHRMRPGESLPEKAQRRLTDLNTLGPQAFARARAPRLIHQPSSKPRVLDAAVQAMERINPAAYRQAVHMLATGDLSAMAAAVGQDSLTLCGAEDQITPPQQTRDCHQALVAADPGAIHINVQIPGAGHLVHQEQPAAVAQHILDFTGWQKTGSAV